ncbi:MAG: peptide ABC transporter substrate-binding protein [Anaerolineae bacterium]|nr:MAG: peptide ABC transporter substrate-binding protein [Anaerolineae bacterium]
MNLKKSFALVFAVLMIASLALAACQPKQVEVVKTVVVTEVVEKEGKQVVVTQVVEVTPEPEMVEQPVTLDWNWSTEPPTIDPSLATDTTSVDVIRNLFVTLTQFDPVTGELSPYLATSWESGEDAEGNQTWTFHLRDDIQWVQYDPTTGETTAVTDGDGNPRYVNAFDVEYGVKRTLDPATASDYAYVDYIIKNGQAVNTGAEGVTVDDIGVKALDATTVQFTLETPAAYFPAIAGMWVNAPMPQWAIDEWGEKWTEAGLINTNGPYVLESWIHGGELDLVKNPLWINAADVQIERVHGVMITEASTAFSLYENNELDSTGVPLPEMDRVKADPVLSAEYNSAPVPCTYYYGFTNNKPPFDDVRVRKAFVEAIDRQSLIDNVLKGGQIPATSFAPPGIFGAPEPGTVGLPYNPDDAKAQLQAYLDEKGMSLDEFNAMGITLMHNTSEGHAQIAAAIQQMWKDVLGVDVKVENQEWKVYLSTIRNTTPLDEMPHIWRLGWCADYPDENNWVHEVFNNQAGANRLRRGCLDETCTQVEPSKFDELTVQAQKESDPAKRAELYAEAERILAEEEVAYAPIYHYTRTNVTKPWLTRNFPPLGGVDFFNWKLDMAAKLAAQGK